MRSTCAELTKAFITKSEAYVIDNPDNPVYKTVTSIEEKQLRLLELSPSDVAKRLGLLEYYNYPADEKKEKNPADKKKEKNMRVVFSNNKSTAIRHLLKVVAPSTPKKKATIRQYPATIGHNIRPVHAETPEPLAEPAAAGGGEDLTVRDLFGAVGSKLDQMAGFVMSNQQLAMSNQRNIAALTEAGMSNRRNIAALADTTAKNQRDIRKVDASLDDFKQTQNGWNKRHARHGRSVSARVGNNADRISALERKYASLSLTPSRRT